MSYQVLARKYRPQNFDEVVGQEHVTRTLKNAIQKNRLHHAYLFTGVRGTGKTSLARILAMALNCEDGPKVDPDPNSSSCQAIAKGQFLDVIEIDGASNTSVESVRELREQVKYVPAAGKYKIYIIDEVHMLSTSAFNALLKTLEEPPPHVVFVFATTEVHKIPVTILSRCQRFDLRRLSQEQILGRLEKICGDEKVKSDAASLKLVARSAEGSMRDGLSLLDMAIGLCGQQLKVDPIREMLGLVEATWIEDLTADCLRGDLAPALDKVQKIYDRGLDLRQAALQWVDHLHDLTLLKAVGPEVFSDPGKTPDKIELMSETIAPVDLDALQVAAQTVYRASEQIFRSDSPKVLFDLLLVKLVHGSPYESLGALLAGTSGTRKSGTRTSNIGHRTSGTRTSDTRTLGGVKPEIRPPVVPAAQEAGGSEEGLERVLKKLPRVKAFLEHAVSHTLEGDRLTVTFEEGSMWVEMFQEKRAKLAQQLKKELGKAVKVEVCEIPKAAPSEKSDPSQEEREIPGDPVIKQAVEILNATVKEVKRYGHE